jgi:hypothetical protein
MNKSFIALGALLISGAVFAANDMPVVDTSSAHQAGIYAGLALGWTEQVVSSDVEDYVDHDEFGGQINVGYSFMINDNLLIGPELGYGYYGDTSTKYGWDYDVNTTATDVLAVANYYVTNKINLIGKLGVAFTTAEDNEDYSEDKTVAMLGLGAGYDITTHVNANVTYYHIFGDEDDLNEINSVFAGVTYMF